MPTIERSEIVKQLVTSCAFPKRTDVEDHTCHICQEASLGPHGGEIPIKLRCGHILGMACLTTWTFQQIEEVENRSPGCPFCRSPLLNLEGPNPAANRDSDDYCLTSVWLPALASWTPGGDEQYDQSDDADTWIQHAEHLWDDLCKEILNDLDAYYFSHGPGLAIRAFLCGNAVAAEQFLSFGTVFQFYQNYFLLGWRPLANSIPGDFPVRYKKLIDHLKTASTVRLDEEKWRVRQAFQSPQHQLDEFRGRMERSRAKLGARVGRVMEGET